MIKQQTYRNCVYYYVSHSVTNNGTKLYFKPHYALSGYSTMFDCTVEQWEANSLFEPIKKEELDK